MHHMSLPLSSIAAPASTTPQPTPQAIPDASQSAYIALASALFSALSLDSHFSSWNTDIGTSAHMTFNCHWMHNMMLHCIPIHLADGAVVYSEGISTVQFSPVVHGQEMAKLEFTNVLYVPSLSSNLLSVLYLTMYHSFTILIERDTLYFIWNSKIIFQACLSPSNSTFLLGETIPGQQIVFLLSSSPLPLDLSLGIVASATTTWQG